MEVLFIIATFWYPGHVGGVTDLHVWGHIRCLSYMSLSGIGGRGNSVYDIHWHLFVRPDN